MNKLILSVVVATLVVGGGAFYGGMKYAQSQIPQRGAQQRNQQFAGGVGGARSDGGGFVSGDIISKDDKSVTVKLRDGGSKIIFLSTSAVIMKATAGSLTDLVVGQQITVTGKTNSDGSVTAESIQIRPPSSVGR